VGKHSRSDHRILDLQIDAVEPRPGNARARRGNPVAGASALAPDVTKAILTAAF
jgi:hypothetical protein